MQSIDEFTPSTTEPVFGSGLVNQTKNQSSTNNDNSDTDKVTPSSEPVANGENDTKDNKVTSNENRTPETATEKNDAVDSTAVLVDGQSEKPTVETNNEVEKSEKPAELETPAVPTEPEPVSSTPAEANNEVSSSAPSTTVDAAPLVPTVEITNDNVTEAPKPTESETTEPKSKSPRGKAKASPVSTTPTATRQSSRGRKAASSSSTNVEENQTSDDASVPTTTTTTNHTEVSKRTKRQAATIAKDAITASNQTSSTSGSSIADDGNDQDVIPSDGDDNDDITVGRAKKASSVGRKKRGASSSTTHVAKKARGKSSLISTTDDDDDDEDRKPAKKVRTNSPKKTLEAPSEEYIDYSKKPWQVVHRQTDNIFLFIPNIIGYVRIFLSIASFYFMPTHPIITVLCYLTSELLDALDGHAARALGQSTKFGAMFDMLIDRCSTMCLCFVLAMFYPSWALFFQLWAAIDVASHWLHLHAATVKGSESHKKIDLSGNPVLRLYYTSRKVLFTMCAGNELWFSMVYLLHFGEGPGVITYDAYTIGLWRIILYAVTPIMALKQIISLIHLYTAALDMAAIDEAERARQK
ncbi:unnamed protein product [Rotaria magnacalcarata]|uniref:CDP-diacylglycerol--inositol 3-phosphatidyltransferase n=1 Tax=Rotaria magnacalcarata TaxID=392030 RepID=A0A819AMT5_9BILA|nr:unnamed protein product [Rotaria magnacalcarata]